MTRLVANGENKELSAAGEIEKSRNPTQTEFSLTLYEGFLDFSCSGQVVSLTSTSMFNPLSIDTGREHLLEASFGA